MKTFYVPVFLTQCAVIEVKADSWEGAIDAVDKMDSEEVGNQAHTSGDLACEVDLHALDEVL